MIYQAWKRLHWLYVRLKLRCDQFMHRFSGATYKEEMKEGAFHLYIYNDGRENNVQDGILQHYILWIWLLLLLFWQANRIPIFVWQHVALCVNMHGTAINLVLPQPTVLALAGFSSEILRDTTSCARLSAPIYLSTGGKESITAVENFPRRRSVSTHDKAPEALIFPSLTHSIHLSLSPPCISTSSHPSLNVLHRSYSYASSRACN